MKKPEILCEECGKPEELCECYLVDVTGDDIVMWTPEDDD